MSNVVKFPKDRWDYIIQYNQSYLACFLANQYDEKKVDEFINDNVNYEAMKAKIKIDNLIKAALELLYKK